MDSIQLCPLQALSAREQRAQRQVSNAELLGDSARSWRGQRSGRAYRRGLFSVAQEAFEPAWVGAGVAAHFAKDVMVASVAAKSLLGCFVPKFLCLKGFFALFEASGAEFWALAAWAKG